MSTDEQQLDPPAELSAGGQHIWRQLLGQHSFELHELLALRRALGWWDRSDALLVASETAAPAEAARLLKSAMDASTSALRHWRLLKFENPATPKRRPGRPSGSDWSPERRAMVKAV